jgi:hypothetical protein
MDGLQRHARRSVADAPVLSMRGDGVSYHCGRPVPGWRSASGEWLRRSHPAMNDGHRHPR